MTTWGEEKEKEEKERRAEEIRKRGKKLIKIFVSYQIHIHKYMLNVLKTCNYMYTYCTFNDFCNIPIGKSGVGAVVSQRRKSGCGLVILSRAFSRSMSQRTSK